MNFVFWNILKNKPELAKSIEKVLGLNKIAAKILSARFDSLDFIKKNLINCEFESPFKMLNMDIAVSRLKKAVSNNEKIAIYGDYDCDGVCASAILFTYLRQFNANVLCYIPKRDEGYGLNVDAINSLQKKGVSLIVTVDNGIKAVEEAKLISNLGIDLIVTDHHNVASELPKAVAVLNPKQPGDSSSFKEICGSVVALKFVAAMENGNFDFAFNFAGDLAAIATVADLVPLVDENRLIVAKGLLQIENSKNLGLIELLKLVFLNERKRISSTELAFKVCPLINAAGRIKNATLAFELLVCGEIELAKRKAAELVKINLLRKQIQFDLIKKAFVFISENVSCLSLPVLVVYGRGWPSGLIGLVAGGLLQKFKKPVVVLAIENEMAVGSARSFESFKIFDALNYCSDLFLKWGGHDFAGGLTIRTDKIKNFIFKINEFSKSKSFAFVHKVDLVARLSDVNLNFVKLMQSLEPFGKFNEQPSILFKNLRLLRIVPLKQGAHLRLEFMQNGFKASFLAFNTNYREFYCKEGCEFNIIAQVEINEFAGTISLVFKLIDLRPVELKQSNLIESFNLLKNKKIYKNQNLSQLEFQKFKPARNDFIFIYLKLKKIKVFYGGFFQFFCYICNTISCFKVFVVLQVFIELGLIEFSGLEIKLKEFKNKQNRINLKSSRLLSEWFD